MRDLAPAAGTVGTAALLWVFWEFFRVLWTRGLMVGVTGTSLDLRVAEPGGSWWLEFGVPALAAVVVFGAGLALGKLRPPAHVGLGLLGAGGVAVLGWTVFAALAGLSATLDGFVSVPVFFHVPDSLTWWGAWGRWWFDLALLGGMAGLLATGPVSASPRRAVFAIGLGVLADSVWRALVSLGGGEVPMLVSGAGVWSSVVDVIHVVLGVFAALFVLVFANLPDRDGPRRHVLLGLLGLAGIWAGLQGALLFTAGTLQSMGLDGRLIFPMPLYEAQLAALRLALLSAGATAVLLGLWREDG